jgi:uncharacterized protein
MGKRSNFVARSIAALLAVFVLTLVALAGAYVQARQTSPGQVSVSGSATVSASPDTASFSIGVTTSASSVKTALAQNNARVAMVITAVLHDGVPKKDLQTSNLSVNPVTNNSGITTGYQVSNSLNVTTHSLATVGTLVNDAVSVAGNDAQLSGITFSVSHSSAALDQARREALANARGEASALAKNSGTSVGRVLRISENDSTSSPSPVAYAATLGAVRSSVPIASGSQTVTVQVNATYQLKN